jgi:hypothetical protein
VKSILLDIQDAFEKNGIRFSERVMCIDVPRLCGTVLRCDENGVDVRWDDGTLGELAWRHDVAYNAYRLQVVRRPLAAAGSSAPPLHARHPYDVAGSEYLPETCQHPLSVGAICRECALDAVRRLIGSSAPPQEKLNDGNPYIFCDTPRCIRGAGHSGQHVLALMANDSTRLLAPIALSPGSDRSLTPESEK